MGFTAPGSINNLIFGGGQDFDVGRDNGDDSSDFDIDIEALDTQDAEAAPTMNEEEKKQGLWKKRESMYVVLFQSACTMLVI